MADETKVIYKATNLINGKVYIGQTNNLARRIREHRGHAYKDGGAFHEDIRKYGIEQFQFDIIEECRSSDADARERFFIAQARDQYGKGNVYNYCDGGIGGQTHDVTGTNNPQYGRHWTEEEKLAVSKKLSGKTKPPEFGQKISMALKGKPKSRSAVLKRSIPVTVKEVKTGNVIRFDSRADMQRTIHGDMQTLRAGKVTRSGYVLCAD